MANYVVVADDLTGANATGALLKKLKLKTVNIINCCEDNSIDKEKYDTIVCSTDSRAIEKEEAYNRVFEMTKLVKDESIKIYNKRIDSTLRGNIGSEIDAMLDALDDERIAMIVPSFPDAKRIAIGGYLIVNGAPLEESDAAHDPKKPISTSIIKTIVEEQSKYEVGIVSLNSIVKGPEAIKEEILKLYKKGKRLLICDAMSNKDLQMISKAALSMDIKFITVDPGPFTASVVNEIITNEKALYVNSNNKKILMCVGSITNTTKTQLEKLGKDMKLTKAKICTEKLLNTDEEKEEEINRVTNEIIQNQHNSNILCIEIDSIYPNERVDLNVIAKEQNTTIEDLSVKINDAIAEMSYRVLKKAPCIEGIFSSGGDISVAICKRFKSVGLEIIGEVIPLAAYGQFIGGEFPNLKIVSKGGMVGDENGMEVCIKYLIESINKKDLIK
ncbi:candidate type III effector Hop protein [Clostridium novyi A str. 4540]|uniref:four-carbon acid sugar kinase family protein n=1 Tax=Clostridium novyi TaxID=1542 RepID=UPI0004D416AB|nr:four-carbon acid sugar kinase family protein [Clostridium novyi]KEH86554.1 candidate type III effector Hop protein [Clostridium novyi A str. 4540]